MLALSTSRLVRQSPSDLTSGGASEARLAHLLLLPTTGHLSEVAVTWVGEETSAEGSATTPISVIEINCWNCKTMPQCLLDVCRLFTIRAVIFLFLNGTTVRMCGRFQLSSEHIKMLNVYLCLNRSDSRFLLSFFFNALRSRLLLCQGGGPLLYSPWLM